MGASFNKKDMLNDLTMSIAKEIVRVETHFGTDAKKAIFKGSDNQSELTFSQIKHLPIADTMSCLYDYGIMGEDVNSDDPHIHVTNGLDWINSQLNADLININVPDSLTKTVYTAQARLALEEGKSLSISWLALLAQINERSVRNAASKKEFQTESQGSQTFISNEEARGWLVNRRGFIQTKSSNKHIGDIQDVRTRTDLGNYLKRVREDKNISIVKLSKAIGDESTTYDVVNKIEIGMEEILIEHAKSISNALDIDFPALFAAIIKTYYPDKVSEILSAMKSRYNEVDEA